MLTCHEVTRLCFLPLNLLAKWLLVKPEAQTPPAPSAFTLKTGASEQKVAFGASPCLDALAAYLVRHRLCAQPNCLRCAPQAGGVNFLVLPVRQPWAIVRAEVCYPLALVAVVRKWLKRKAAFRLLRPRKTALEMPCGKCAVWLVSAETIIAHPYSTSQIAASSCNSKEADPWRTNAQEN